MQRLELKSAERADTRGRTRDLRQRKATNEPARDAQDRYIDQASDASFPASEGITSALGLLAIDVWYTATRRISPIYLLDAAAEAALVAAWSRARPLRHTYHGR